ncbi:thiamine-phosphate kinase [Terrarubrum flagellatum]|uniref:thiamine-phosphate kinase n=1 Tax=Terrirubrum flagellatum TaxID=2895980 RepID=UPI0031452A6C
MPSAEDDFISRYFAPIAGEGGLKLKDDAALIAPPAGCELVVTTDGVSQGRHFLDDAPASIARKALRVNLSDLAAKGADPLGFVLTLALPASWDASTRDAFMRPFAQGLGEDAAAYGCSLLGGDTMAIDGPLTLSITAFGAVGKGCMVRRTGAQPGDLLVVSGTIGDAALGLKLRRAIEGDQRGATKLLGLSDEHRAFLLDAYLHPRPRNVLARALRDHAHGAMDISDGFIGDFAKMLEASGVGGVIDATAAPLSAAGQAAVALDPALQRTAVTGGDDYEIAAACSVQAWPALAKLGEQAGVPLTVIGRVGQPGESIMVEPAAFASLLSSGSYSHF